jgi:Holliday junction resolvase-like predicted endonuclease
MPAKHPADRGELGRRGEALACARLTAAGLRIVVRN